MFAAIIAAYSEERVFFHEATGVQRLALACRAPLLAVTTSRNGVGAFQVTLHPLAAAGGGVADEEGVEPLARGFAQRYAEAVRATPALWPVSTRRARRSR